MRSGRCGRPGIPGSAPPGASAACLKEARAHPTWAEKADKTEPKGADRQSLGIEPGGTTPSPMAQKIPESGIGRERQMLETLIVLLIVAWLLGAFVFPVGGALIHLILLVALVVLIVRLVRPRAAL